MAHLRLVAKNRCGDDELAAVIDMFAAVADVLGLDDDDRAAILNVPGMAFPLRPGRPALSSWQECRLRQVIDLGTALGLLLGDGDEIAEWMRTPRPSHGGVSPVRELIDDEKSLGRIRRELTDECRSRFGPVAWSTT